MTAWYQRHKHWAMDIDQSGLWFINIFSVGHSIFRNYLQEIRVSEKLITCFTGIMSLSYCILVLAFHYYWLFVVYESKYPLLWYSQNIIIISLPSDIWIMGAESHLGNFITAVTLNSIIASVTVFAFCILRPLKPDIYAPRVEKCGYAPQVDVLDPNYNQI